MCVEKSDIKVQTGWEDDQPDYQETGVEFGSDNCGSLWQLRNPTYHRSN